MISCTILPRSLRSGFVIAGQFLDEFHRPLLRELGKYAPHDFGAFLLAYEASCFSQTDANHVSRLVVSRKPFRHHLVVRRLFGKLFQHRIPRNADVLKVAGSGGSDLAETPHAHSVPIPANTNLEAAPIRYGYRERPRVVRQVPDRLLSTTAKKMLKVLDGWEQLSNKDVRRSLRFGSGNICADAVDQTGCKLCQSRVGQNSSFVVAVGCKQVSRYRPLARGGIDPGAPECVRCQRDGWHDKEAVLRKHSVSRPPSLLGDLSDSDRRHELADDWFRSAGCPELALDIAVDTQHTERSVRIVKQENSPTSSVCTLWESLQRERPQDRGFPPNQQFGPNSSRDRRKGPSWEMLRLQYLAVSYG